MIDMWCVFFGGGPIIVILLLLLLFLICYDGDCPFVFV